MVYNKSITATVYIVHENSILLHMHKKYKTWFPFGGHVEADEFPYQAAIREAKEESGLDIKLLSTENAGEYDLGLVERIPLPFVTCRCGDEEEFYDFIYIAFVDNTNTSPMEGESTELRWFSKEELKSMPTLKTHVRNTALTVIEYLENRNK